MLTPEQKKKLLKSKIALALHAELGRVPKTEEIEQMFLCARVLFKAVLGRITNGRNRSNQGNWQSSKHMLIGYARVSTHDQTLNLQRDALTKAGCTKIFTDTASGAKTERIGLEEALNYVRKGDTLVVWRLDRLGRSLPHLITTMTSLEEQGIGFKSLTENIDTTTSGGKLIFHIFGALAEFERNLIRERTQAGLTAARERTERRQTQALTAKQRSIAQSLYDDPKNSIPEICQTLKISKATFYRYVKPREPQQPRLRGLIRHLTGRW